ncbi:hypothetical protein AgCh_005804 [Apium graveolens]
MLIEMLCEEQGFFLEIVDIIRGLGLTILEGVMEIQATKVKRLCTTQNTIIVNGQFPGPTLEINNGDTLELDNIRASVTTGATAADRVSGSANYA